MWYAKVYVSIMSKVKRFSPWNKLVSRLFYSYQAYKCIIRCGPIFAIPMTACFIKSQTVGKSSNWGFRICWICILGWSVLKLGITLWKASIKLSLNILFQCTCIYAFVCLFFSLILYECMYFALTHMGVTANK
jgi:hypothetical protein